MAESDPIRVLVFQEAEQYVAQCLEHDITVQAPTIQKLRARLKLAMELEAEECIARGKEPFECIGPAPEYYHKQWREAPEKLSPDVVKDRTVELMVA